MSEYGFSLSHIFSYKDRIFRKPVFWYILRSATLIKYQDCQDFHEAVWQSQAMVKNLPRKYWAIKKMVFIFIEVVLIYFF